MLSLLKRKPKPPVELEPLALIECPISAPEPTLAAEPMRRWKQQNIKVTEDVGIAFEAIARALCISKAALFEDMVAERLEALQSRGVMIEISRS
jgi:hypothetical protein